LYLGFEVKDTSEKTTQFYFIATKGYLFKFKIVEPYLILYGEYNFPPANKVMAQFYLLGFKGGFYKSRKQRVWT